MALDRWLEMTAKQRREEKGAEPPCPFCKKPRVQRSDYVRCNSCGVNWLDLEINLPNYLGRDPRVARALMEAATRHTVMPSAGDAR